MKGIAVADTKQCTFKLADSVIAELTALEIHFNTSTRSEALRKAVRIAKYVADMQAQGRAIGFKRPDGTFEETIII